MTTRKEIPSVDQLWKLFDIAQELYRDRQHESGVIDPIPFAWVRNDQTGELIVYSAFQKHSKDIEKLLGIPPPKVKKTMNHSNDSQQGERNSHVRP